MSAKKSNKDKKTSSSKKQESGQKATALGHAPTKKSEYSLNDASVHYPEGSHGANYER